MVDAAKALSVATMTQTVDSTSALGAASVNQASRPLQDAYISLTLPRTGALAWRVDAGQLKLPLSMEALQSASRLATVERALFNSDRTRGPGYASVRDVGLVVRARQDSRVQVDLGAFNGTGERQNSTDGDAHKAVVVRAVVRPSWLSGVQLGASAVRGNGDGATDRRDRWGGELSVDHGQVSAKGEWMSGRDGSVRGQGYYAHLGYTVHPTVEIVARLDSFDPDLASEATIESVRELDYLVGASFSLAGLNARLQLNLVQKTFGAFAGRRQLLANLQTGW